MMLAEIAGLLAAEGLGTLGTDLFYSSMPDAPDNLVVLYVYGAESPDRDHDDDAPGIEHPGLQVIVRHTDYDQAQATAAAVWVLLSQVRNRTIAGVFYQKIEPRQSPFLLRYDESNRAEIACNYYVAKQPS